MQVEEIIEKITERVVFYCKLNMKEEDVKKVVTCILIETVSILPMLQRNRETTALVFTDMDGKDAISAVVEYDHTFQKNNLFITFDIESIKDIPRYEIENGRMVDLVALRCYFLFKMKFIEKRNLIRILRIFTSVVKEYALSNNIKSLNIKDFMRTLEINTRELPKLFNK